VKKFKEKYKTLILTMFITLLAVVFLFPLILTVSNSFMGEGEIAENYKPITNASEQSGAADREKTFVNLKLIPDEVVVKQYYIVLLQKTKFLYMFWNSMALVLPIIVGQIIVASMAAYAFAKINFRWREQLFFIYIITMLMPFQVTLVPNYIVADKLGILDNYLSIIFPGIFGTFGVFLLRQFMEYIPDGYSEAARVDGAGHFRIFLKIIMPLSKSGLAALAILVFMDNWNMVEQPVVFLQDRTKHPLSVFLTSINHDETGIAFAASVLYMMPMLLIFLYGENYLIEGIQLSGIKG
jgi:multiple sugar transport system permease protein